MTDKRHKKPRHQELETKLETLLQEYADVIGPIQCQIHDESYALCDCDDVPDGAYAAQTMTPMLMSWFICLGYATFDEDDKVEICRFFGPQSQSWFTSKGLITDICENY